MPNSPNSQRATEVQPELRHLRAFLAVADQGSASRAGATLFRAQSAVSRSIHKLEHDLGVALFERRARGMLLTQYGQALLVRARRAHAEMQRARSELGALADKGSVRNAAIFGLLAHERRVQAFVTLAEQHHMPSVAESLGITQPAVSIALRLSPNPGAFTAAQGSVPRSLFSTSVASASASTPRCCSSAIRASPTRVTAAADAPICSWSASACS